MCQEPQLEVINTGVSNHRKAHPCSTWEVSVGWGPSWGSHLEDPHMAKAMGCGFCHMVARFQGQEERERESGRGHIALYDQPHESQNVLSLIGAATGPAVFNGRELRDPTSGWGGLFTPPYEHVEWDVYWGDHI